MAKTAFPANFHFIFTLFHFIRAAAQVKVKYVCTAPHKVDCAALGSVQLEIYLERNLLGKKSTWEEIYLEKNLLGKCPARDLLQYNFFRLSCVSLLHSMQCIHTHMEYSSNYYHIPHLLLAAVI